MGSRKRLTRLLAWLMVFAVFTATAEDKPAPEKPDIPEPTQFVTSHSGQFGGQTVRYTATAGETYLRDKKGEPTAAMFTFAYVKDGVDDPAQRPVTFVWNGGPGSASMWLHMGTFGPQRISVPSDAQHAGSPPYTVLPSTETILDITDLVFIDPVGTGYSRALGATPSTDFWGLNEDARSIADFIQVWVTENGRWNSPKYLLGESYGTTRAGAVVEILQGNGDMMNLNGLIMVSQALDYTGSTPTPDNLIAFATYLPTMAATAYYHNRVSPMPATLEGFVAEARTFVTDEYLPALFLGTFLDDVRRNKVAERLAYFTGLDQSYVERANLRVSATRFAKELLRDQGLAVGRLDSRYTRDEIDDTGAEPARDAASDAISGAYKASLLAYLHSELKVDWDRKYLAPADDELGKNWRYRTASDKTYWEPAYVNTAPGLSKALRRNPELRVLVASGYYDLVTPFFDAEYTLARHGIQRDRVTFTYYEGGHMMYVHEPSRTKLLEDVREFMD